MTETTHERTRIRAQAVEHLAGLPATEDRVYAGRTRPLPKGHRPSLLVYTREEVSGRPMEGQGASIGRELALVIEGRVQMPATVVPDDALDEIAFQVEGRMRGTTLDGLVFDAILARTTVECVADGESQNGTIRMEYRARYCDPSEEE